MPRARLEQPASAGPAGETTARRRSPATVGHARGAAPGKTSDVRTALELAFEGIGGVARLTAWAETNDTQFYRLWSRLTPMRVTGADGEALTIQIVRHADCPPAE